MLFIVFRDGAAQYINLDGDSKVQAALGNKLLARKFFSCDGARRETASAPSGVTQSESMTAPTDLLNDPKFKSAYYKALGPRGQRNLAGQARRPGAIAQEDQGRGYGVRACECLQESRLRRQQHGSALFCGAGCRLRKDLRAAQSNVDRSAAAGCGFRIGTAVARGVAAEVRRRR